jgi:hypothetical protein
MINPFFSAVLLVILICLGFVFATTNSETPRVINCDLVEFHPDMAPYREACRALRGGQR